LSFVGVVVRFQKVGVKSCSEQSVVRHSDYFCVYSDG
jgi:hypothetical protein